jgi:long-chain fatty acid transport protein
VDDYGAVVVNPAALAASAGRGVWLGYDAARFSPTLRGYAGPRPAQAAFAGGVLGVRLPVAPTSLPLGVTLGLALTSPRDVIVRADLPLPETPQFPLLSSRAQALELALSVGVRLSSRWFVGIGARGLAGLEADVAVPTEEERGGVENELSLNLAPLVGVLFRDSLKDSFGFVYRGALSAPFQVELRDPGLQGIALPPLHIDGLAHYDPAELGFEWAHRFGETRVALGVVYQRWSAFGGWLGQTVTCPEGEPPCGALPKESIVLSNTLNPRVGIAYPLDLRSVELTLRAGYAFEPSPLPEQTELANRWDNARSSFTLGYGVDLRGTPFAFNVAYQAQVLHERTHIKHDPERDPSLARVRVSGLVQFVGLDAELRY